MSAESEHALRVRTAQWFRVRWLLPVVNLLMVGAIVFLILGHFQDTGKLDAIQISSAVVQAFDQSQINANARNAQAALAFDNVLAKFFAEEDFICQELVAHNEVLGGPIPPPGICDVSLTPHH